jgi:pimeloyl-ACP methyl ester carboxylesterase
VIGSIRKPALWLILEALRAKYADPAGHIADIDGVQIYYKDEGSGPAILMIHGSVSTLKTYDRVAAKLTHRYRVIRYDVPPGGLSGAVSDEAAAKLKPVDLAEGLLARLGVKRATVVGVSSGGTLGVQLAAERPDLVERLILSNTPADPVVTTQLVQPPAFLKEQAEAKRTGFQSQAFWNAYLDYFSGDPTRISADLRRQYYDMNRRTPEKHPIALVAQVANHAAAVEAMTHVVAPTLLIWGGRDPLLTPASADVLAAYLTKAQVSKVIMPDVGHYPPLEVPERFAQIVAAYIEAVTPGAS